MSDAPRTARAVARAELTRAILDSATQQLAEVGPAALSVRAVARDLGMASSAVYRYFASRDDLLTALLVEAYDDLGAAVEEADAAVTDRDDVAARWRATAGAVHDWARAHPHRYALTYGSPVPGYAAPQDTVEPATRAPRVLLQLLADALAAGRGVRDLGGRVDPAEVAATGPISAVTEPPLPPEATVRALAVWATLFGHVSLELFGHMNNAVLDYDTHFATVVDLAAYDLGLA
ncbi:MAG: TetR family transcriptional regulator [Nocardioides sp.]|nr:TetR family transcriptional regulator [Nocardioides sp.]